jgi:hypothetical protein
MAMTTQHRIINAIGFQAAWWLCVLSVPAGMDIPAVIVCAFLMGLHLWTTDEPLKDVRLAVRVLGLGVVLDSLLQAFSIIQFHGWSFGHLSPLWLWALWILLALTLNASLAFLKKCTWWLCGLIGLISGPASYLGGAALGAATLDRSPLHLAVLALMWAFALPAMVWMARQTHPAP